MREATLGLPTFAARFDRGDPDPVNQWTNVADGSLAAATIRGSPEAYGELVRRHQIAVYNVAYRLVGERQAALDVTQDAFVRAYRSLQTFIQDLPFGPWIKRIATNVALTWLEPLPLDLVPLVLRRIEAPRPGWANRVGAGLLVGQTIAGALAAAWYLTQSPPDVLGPGWSGLTQPVTFLLAGSIRSSSALRRRSPTSAARHPTASRRKTCKSGGLSFCSSELSGSSVIACF